MNEHQFLARKEAYQRWEGKPPKSAVMNTQDRKALLLELTKGELPHGGYLMVTFHDVLHRADKDIPQGFSLFQSEGANMTRTKIRFEWGRGARESTTASWPGIPRRRETLKLKGRNYLVWEVIWVQDIGEPVPHGHSNVEVIVRLR